MSTLRRRPPVCRAGSSPEPPIVAATREAVGVDERPALDSLRERPQCVRRKGEVVVETVDETSESSPEDEEATGGKAPSITELLVRLGRDVSVLVFCETHLAAARNLPEVRRAARDIAAMLLAALAFLTAFV